VQSSCLDLWPGVGCFICIDGNCSRHRVEQGHLSQMGKNSTISFCFPVNAQWCVVTALFWFRRTILGIAGYYRIVHPAYTYHKVVQGCKQYGCTSSCSLCSMGAVCCNLKF